MYFKKSFVFTNKIIDEDEIGIASNAAVCLVLITYL